MCVLDQTIIRMKCVDFYNLEASIFDPSISRKYVESTLSALGKFKLRYQSLYLPKVKVLSNMVWKSQKIGRISEGLMLLLVILAGRMQSKNK